MDIDLSTWEPESVNQRKKLVVLVIDDEPAIQEVVRDILDPQYNVISVFNAAEGFKMAKNLNPALILLDVMMPGINGYDALRNLSTDPATGKIPVIIVTGRDFDRSTREMFMSEPNLKDILQKPVRPKTLREIVKKAILGHA